MPTVAIHLLSLALCLSSGFQQGYIASVLNQPYLEIESYINESWTQQTGHVLSEPTLNMVWSLLNVCFPIATIFGQFLAAYMCKRFGRKRTALIASFMYVPAAVLSASAKWIPSCFELLFVGRILWSLANGVNSVNATVWLIECAPTSVRGTMAAMQEFFMALGSLLTQAVGIPFSTETLWPLVFIPNVIVALIAVAMFSFVSESPQYIMETTGDEAKARESLASYHGVPADDPEIDAEMRICEESLGKKKPNKKAQEMGIAPEHDGLTIMFMPWKATDPASQVIRQGAWLGVMVKIAYVFTGARCLRSYSTFILYSLGHWPKNQALYLSFLTGLLRLPVTLVPVFLVDRLGRRPLIICSTTVSFLALALMIVSIDNGAAWQLGTMIGLTALLLINACGLGSVSRFYSAELVPRNLLLSSVSILTMFEALTKIAVEFAWFPLANIIGASSLFLFAGPTAVFLILMWAKCPETSRRSVNEVLNEIAQRKGVKVSFPT